MPANSRSKAVNQRSRKKKSVRLKADPKVSDAELFILTNGSENKETVKKTVTKPKINFYVLLNLFLVIILAFVVLTFNFIPRNTTLSQYETATLATEIGILREGNGIEFPVVTSVTSSHVLYIIDNKHKSWVKVRLKNGVEGWIERSKIEH